MTILLGSAIIEKICISPGHNYFGRHGLEPEKHPVIELPEASCVAGAGLEGDRFFNYKANYKGQVTFFAMEVYDVLCLHDSAFSAAAIKCRRNVFTREVNLNGLIGHHFSIQGITFEAVEECKPCHWMDQAFFPGAEKFLRGQGGLRARILTSGTLRVNPSTARESELISASAQ